MRVSSSCGLGDRRLAGCPGLTWKEAVLSALHEEGPRFRLTATSPSAGYALPVAGPVQSACPFRAPGSFPSPCESGFLWACDVRHDFSRGCCSVRDTRPLNGLIWPKDGCASIACAATAAVKLSSPAGFAGIPREARKPHPRHPPLRCGPQAGASPIAFGLQIAIEAAVVAGSNTARR